MATRERLRPLEGCAHDTRLLAEVSSVAESRAEPHHANAEPDLLLSSHVFADLNSQRRRAQGIVGGK